jgi:hypothetical protein
VGTNCLQRTSRGAAKGSSLLTEAAWADIVDSGSRDAVCSPSCYALQYDSQLFLALIATRTRVVLDREGDWRRGD